MKILLSIKPKYIEKIFKGEKRYEYRKSIFKNKDVESIIVYATKPIDRVIGEFTFDKIIEDDPKDLWDRTYRYSGINKEDFMKYFEGREKGFALCIDKIIKYPYPLELSEIDPTIKAPPQSFRYIPYYCMKHIRKRLDIYCVVFFLFD